VRKSCCASNYPDDGGDELHQEAWDLEEGGIEGVEEVHDEPLDVGAIVVLIRHDHQVPVPELLDVLVLLQRGSAQCGDGFAW
jgi:hypothetical protein